MTHVALRANCPRQGRGFALGASTNCSREAVRGERRANELRARRQVHYLTLPSPSCALPKSQPLPLVLLIDRKLRTKVGGREKRYHRMRAHQCTQSRNPLLVKSPSYVGRAVRKTYCVRRTSQNVPIKQKKKRPCPELLHSETLHAVS